MDIVNAGRNLTPYRRLNLDPLGGLGGVAEGLVGCVQGGREVGRGGARGS